MAVDAPAFIARRPQHFAMSAVCELDFNPEAEPETRLSLVRWGDACIHSAINAPLVSKAFHCILALLR